MIFPPLCRWRRERRPPPSFGATACVVPTGRRGICDPSTGRSPPGLRRRRFCRFVSGEASAGTTAASLPEADAPPPTVRPRPTTSGDADRSLAGAPTSRRPVALGSVRPRSLVEGPPRSAVLTADEWDSEPNASSSRERPSLRASDVVASAASRDGAATRRRWASRAARDPSIRSIRLAGGLLRISSMLTMSLRHRSTLRPVLRLGSCVVRTVSSQPRSTRPPAGLASAEIQPRPCPSPERLVQTRTQMRGPRANRNRLQPNRAPFSQRT